MDITVGDENEAGAELNMSNSRPDHCAGLSRKPSLQVYFALRSKIQRSSETWLSEFLDLDGLQSLLDSLGQMTGKGFTSFSDAILQLDCIGCIRAIVNTQIGLDYFIQKTECTAKLALALDIGNALPKKQILEMLSAVCVYNSHGYQLVIDALEKFKNTTDQTHRFSVIINELKAAETVPHKTAILSLINCLINCTSDLHDRNRIRSEFIGLSLLDVLSFFRKEEADDDLHLQLEVFHVRKHNDEEKLRLKTKVDFNNPTELFEDLYRKIYGSKKMVSFVHILQDLLSLELTEESSDESWESIEDMVQELSHSTNPKQLMAAIRDVINADTTVAAPPLLSCISDELQLKMSSSQKCSSHDVKHQVHPHAHLRLSKSSSHTPNVSNILNSHRKQSSARQTFESASKCPRLGELVNRKHSPGPAPLCQMKGYQWIPIMEVSPMSMWSQADVAEDYIWVKQEDNVKVRPNFCQLEEFFSEQMEGEEPEEPLLDNATQLNVTLFLNRLEASQDDLIQNLIDGDPSLLSLPMLRYLHKVLPEHHEIKSFRMADRKLIHRGVAERFLLLLSDIPDYSVLLDGHLTRAEFTVDINKQKRCVVAMIEASKQILNSTGLKHMLHLILQAGNFLNHGKACGEAEGFTLESLARLEQVKSCVPNLTLLHHLVQQVIEQNQAVLQFATEMTRLDRAASCSVEDIRVDMSKTSSRLTQFVHRLSKAHSHVRDVFQFFIEDVKRDLLDLQTGLKEVRALSHQMAVYFCHNEATFNLQKCLQKLNKFCKRIRKCQNELPLFNKQQNLGRRRMKQLKTAVQKKRLALEFGLDAGASSSFIEQKKNLIENILIEVHRGNFQPFVRSELVTPEMEVNPLDLSHISLMGTPKDMRDGDGTLTDDTLFKPSTSTIKATAECDKPENGDENKVEVRNILPQKTKHQSINFDQPMTRPAPRIQLFKNMLPSHARSRSDLTEAICPDTKWLRYEGMCKREESPAPLAKPESNITLCSLHLESRGRLMSSEDLVTLQEGPILTLPERAPIRKTSVTGFLSRLSRAVLKPRNGNRAAVPTNSYKVTQDLKPKGKGRRKCRESADDKENMEVKVAIQTDLEKRYALREYKRFKERQASTTGQAGKGLYVTKL